MSRSAGVFSAVAAAVVVALSPGAGPAASVSSTWPPQLIGLRTRAGSELVAWGGSAIDGTRNGRAITIVKQSPDVRQPIPETLLQQPDGRLLLYFADDNNPTYATETFRVSSSDDGRTWSAPARTAFRVGAFIESASVRPGGAPVFAATDPAPGRDDLWYLDVFEGIDGGRRTTAYALTSHGTVGTVGGIVYLAYSTDSSIVVPARRTGTFLRGVAPGGRPTEPVRLLSRRETHVFFADGRALYAQGTKLRVVDPRTGRSTTRSLPGYSAFGLADAASDSRGRLWVTWVDGSRLTAVRAARAGAPFRGRAVVDLPSSSGSVPAVSGVVTLARADGSLDVYAAVNAGILHRRLRIR